MGGSQSKQHHSQVFRLEDWQQIQWEPYTNIKDPTFSSNFIVYAHKNNPNLQLEKYQLYFNSQAEYISYLETYYQRRKYPSLVNSIHIEQTTKKNMCSTFHSASVYLQRIHFRLSQLIEIPVEEGLYMIETALEGYEKMFQKTGYFQVSPQMIGVNKLGKVKVWVNKNFSKNFPEFNKIDLNKSQVDFLFQMLRVIEGCMDYPKDKQKFSEFLISKNLIPTFELTRALLKQYEKSNHYTSMKSMKSIVLWVKKNNNKPVQSSTQFFNNLKTSSYSATSEKNYQKLKQAQMQKNNKKIQFSKFKGRMSNSRPIDGNKCFISLPPQILNRQVNQLSVQHQRQAELQTKRVNSTVNPTAQMSFVKIERRAEQLEEKILVDNNNLKCSNKGSDKYPSISFSYKSYGLYSPQNIQSKPNQWFGSKKSKKLLEVETEKQKKKDFRKSSTTDMSQQVNHQKMKFYYSNGDAQQIDPEIAKDLFTMTNNYE